MIDDDRKEFTRAYTKLAALYGAQVNVDIIDTYFTAMKQFSMPAVLRAFDAAASECQFMPKPVELRSYAHEPERFDPDETTYRCLKCYDQSVVVSERFDRDGRSLGAYACPCDCEAGERTRASWEVPDAKGHVFSDTAKMNTAKLRRKGAL